MNAHQSHTSATNSQCWKSGQAALRIPVTRAEHLLCARHFLGPIWSHSTELDPADPPFRHVPVTQRGQVPCPRLPLPACGRVRVHPSICWSIHLSSMPSERPPHSGPAGRGGRQKTGMGCVLSMRLGKPGGTVSTDGGRGGCPSQNCRMTPDGPIDQRQEPTRGGTGPDGSPRTAKAQARGRRAV